MLRYLSALGGQWERGLRVLPDDFRRTVASSILKWVVNHHNSYNKTKSKNKKEEAKNDESGPKKGMHLWGRSAVPNGCGVSGQQ